MFITNNHASLHVWWKEKLLKHQKVSRHYEKDCRYLFAHRKIMGPSQMRETFRPWISKVESSYNALHPSLAASFACKSKHGESVNTFCKLIDRLAICWITDTFIWSTSHIITSYYEKGEHFLCDHAIIIKVTLSQYLLSTLKSHYHIAEDFYQIKLCHNLIRRNTNICLVGVLRWKWMNKFCFLAQNIHWFALVSY